MTPPLLSADGYALLVSIHGYLAALGLALLLHPILSLGQASWRRGQRLSVGLAALLISLPYALGTWVYPSYRYGVKPGLVRDHRDFALAFEVKEHLAFFCLALTWGAAVALWAAGDQPLVRRAARSALACALGCGITVAVIAMLVGTVAHPGWVIPP